MQICSDILQKQKQILEGHPGSSLGAAWVAVIGAKLSEDWMGITNYVSYGDRIEPNPDNAPIYDAGYQKFRDSYEVLAQFEEKGHS
jgi:xylulokinase